MRLGLCANRPLRSYPSLLIELACLALALMALLVGPALAAPRPMPSFEQGPVTKLPLPRFVSLADALANGRAGPDKRHPIHYVYTAKNMPVEVIEEYESYRKVRDWQGAEVWIFRPRLTNTRFVRIQQERSPMRVAPDPTAQVRAYLGEGLYGRIRQCQPGWCQIEAEHVRGWVATDALYGTYEGEIIPR